MNVASEPGAMDAGLPGTPRFTSVHGPNGLQSGPEAPWFVQAFERVYLRIYPHRDDREAEFQAPVLCRLLGLRAGDRVLDVACGAGRHARALARRGLRVTGIDLSQALLDAARERSPGLPGTPSYLRLDARSLPFVSQFEGALSMFTSFGYFDHRDDDLAIMRGVFRALVPQGRFLVDFLNADEVRATLEPRSQRDVDGLELTLERRIVENAPGGPRVEKRVRANQTRTGLLEANYVESVRLYRPEELDALLEEAGFVAVGEPLGDYDGAAFDVTSPRWIRVVRKPGGSR